MKNILFEQRKIKLWNKQYFVENKTDYAACFKNAVMLPKYVNLISRGIFLYAFGMWTQVITNVNQLLHFEVPELVHGAAIK